jgi:hypothetical protein
MRAAPRPLAPAIALRRVVGVGRRGGDRLRGCRRRWPADDVGGRPPRPRRRGSAADEAADLGEPVRPVGADQRVCIPSCEPRPRRSLPSPRGPPCRNRPVARPRRPTGSSTRNTRCGRMVTLRNRDFGPGTPAPDGPATGTTGRIRSEPEGSQPGVAVGVGVGRTAHVIQMRRAWCHWPRRWVRVVRSRIRSGMIPAGCEGSACRATNSPEADCDRDHGRRTSLPDPQRAERCQHGGTGYRP